MPENVGFLSVFCAARRANGKTGGAEKPLCLKRTFLKEKNGSIFQ